MKTATDRYRSTQIEGPTKTSVFIRVHLWFLPLMQLGTLHLCGSAVKTGILLILIVTLTSCERLFRVPPPQGVPSEASRNRKTSLWEWTEPSGAYHMAYPDGKRAVEGMNKTGLRQGEWRSFGPDGRRITSIGDYKDDFRIGLWRFYDDQGILYMTVTYKLEPKNLEITFLSHDYGNENGPTERFFPDGRLEEKSTYLGGLPHGDAVRYFRSGRKATEGRYDRGQRIGTWNFYYPDGGTERIETYVGGRLEGPARNFLPGGALYHESNYKNGVQTDVRIKTGF